MDKVIVSDFLELFSLMNEFKVVMEEDKVFDDKVDVEYKVYDMEDSRYRALEPQDDERYVIDWWIDVDSYTNKDKFVVAMTVEERE